ncbi:MAG: J domain-containing protein [Polyangiaceae bacterium]|nr:J domain-containing protein [Polyangiaceae bacterium]
MTTPTAVGTLSATPLPQLLVTMFDRQLDGTVVFETTDGRKSAVLFEGGGPSKAKTHEPVIYLGRLLLESGKIDAAAHDRTLATIARDRRLHGQVLLDEGLIDADTLRRALRDQVARKVLWLATLPADTRYGFYDRVDYLVKWGGADQDRAEVLPLVFRAAQVQPALAVVEAALTPLRGQTLRLHVDAQLQRFRLGREEQALADVLRAKPQSIESLLATELCSRESTLRLVWALVVTRYLDLGVPGVLPLGVDEPPSSSRRSLPVAGAPRARGQRAPASPSAGGADAGASAGSSELAEERRAFTALAEGLEAKSHYEVLEVPRDATAEAVSTAYFALARRLHPDRLRPELAELRPLANKIFARLNEAKEVLTDAARRAAYDADAGRPQEEQEQVKRVLDAATRFQRAEILLRRGQLAQAEAEARLAVEGDSTQAEYAVLLAWIMAQSPDRAAAAKYDDLLEVVSGAVAAEPANERSRFVRAQILARMGRADEAVKDFRWVADRNPRNLDAVREVRLYEMRHATSQKSGGKDGTRQTAGKGDAGAARSTGSTKQTGGRGEGRSTGQSGGSSGKPAGGAKPPSFFERLLKR